MNYNELRGMRKHPCEVCKFKEYADCWGCIWDSWNHKECSNYECAYYDGDTACDAADECGAYVGAELNRFQQNLLDDYGEEPEDEE